MSVVSIRATLEDGLKAAFAGADISLIDQSHLHAGHAGAGDGVETHFQVTVIWDGFDGQNRVARHRAVNAAAEPAISKGLHALQIIAKASNEA